MIGDIIPVATGMSYEDDVMEEMTEQELIQWIENKTFNVVADAEEVSEGEENE